MATLAEKWKSEGILIGREEGWKRGREEGRQEGRQEGRREGVLEAIHLALELKFGDQGLTLFPQIESISSIE